MSTSTFDLYSIGIGPSSSHTVGPMRAAKRFVKSLERLDQVTRLEITLYGSLAFTGEGHGTNKALLMGIEGESPETIDPEAITERMNKINNNKTIHALGQHPIQFDPANDIVHNIKEQLPHHSNGMCFRAFAHKQLIESEVYYSIGGGFIVTEEEAQNGNSHREITLPFPFDSADELLSHCKKQQCTIAAMVMENEKTWRSEADITAGLYHIADTMAASIEKGIRTEGILEGGLKVRRRAPGLYQKMLEYGEAGPSHPQTMNWLNLYAMAVNEENAAGGRVVTAPTNGAAGIIPSVINYYKYFCPEYKKEGIIEFLLTAGAIGMLYKKNASISGAEMGCQGEVGVACSMAAGGLTAALGGTILQVENAAEIGMEHNLGLTCDPVKGLVQIPCIERNAMGSVKAVNAARIALAEDGESKVSLDMVINTMREIGNNMNRIYKETSEGGLAVNVPEC
jgi:L-serine dehydratase